MQFLSWLRQKLGCADGAATSDLPPTEEKTSTIRTGPGNELPITLTPTPPEQAALAKVADALAVPTTDLHRDVRPPAASDIVPSSAPPDTSAATQRPIFENRPDGSAHVEFSGKQVAEKSNVNFRQKAETSVTAWIHETQVSGKAVSNRFHGEQSADVRYQNVDLEATEEDLDLFIKGGKSKWIVGQTKESINLMKRAGLLNLWETYRAGGRNESIKGVDAEALKKDYEDTPEGLAELREFIIRFLAVSNNEDAG